ncbi:MAG: hypothetical protein Q4P66_00040 [Actinomycetaceae bacterium]|nr:hypothetical protein [Actinomycetaceae bacterium]
MPTGGPLGIELTQTVIKHYFVEGTYDVLQSIYHDLGVHNAQGQPRLESVLDCATKAYGTSVLTQIFTHLLNAPPNDLHCFFAKHLLNGGSHITANFDTCIEKNTHILCQPDKWNERLVHFHGSLDDPPESLGARLSVIENGFTPDIHNQIVSLLDNPTVKMLVFCGYSGSDFFDVLPFFRHYGGLLKNKFVIWHSYHLGNLSFFEGGKECERIFYLRLLKKAGARVYSCHGALRDFLNLFFAQDSLFQPLPTKAPCPLPPPMTLSTQECYKR